MSTISTYLQIANNHDKWRAIAAKKSDVSLQTKYFRDNIGKVKTAEEFMKNKRLFDYAMKAFGLGDMTYAAGLMRKVLQQGVSSNSTLAHTLHKPNILAFAKAFDFAANGAATTAAAELIASTVNRYTDNALEADEGKKNPGVQLALYFQKHAPEVSNMYEILADKQLLKVVHTTLGISPMTAAQHIDTQNRLLSSKIKIEDFKEPKKLQAFISRFAAMYDSQGGGGSAAPSNGVAGIDQNLLLQAQNNYARRAFLL